MHLSKYDLNLTQCNHFPSFLVFLFPCHDYLETEQEIFEQVLHGDLDFSSDPWPSISESAKDLVRRMLVRDPRRRLTAHEVLCESCQSLLLLFFSLSIVLLILTCKDYSNKKKLIPDWQTFYLSQQLIVLSFNEWHGHYIIIAREMEVPFTYV